jgi:hypothetical protein
MVGAVSKFAIAAARDPELVVFRRWDEFHREALGSTPSWDAWRYSKAGIGELTLGRMMVPVCVRADGHKRSLKFY